MLNRKVVAFQVLAFGLLLCVANVRSKSGTLLTKDVQFDPEFGGLYGNLAFGKDRTSNYQKFDVMLSTRHSRTFLVDGEQGKCQDVAGQPEPFCAEHKHQYDPTKTRGSLTTNEMTGDMKGKGRTVDGDTIYFLDAKDVEEASVKQKFGIMNQQVEMDPAFWAVQREEAKDTGKLVKRNKADGCFSLSAGPIEDVPNFGDQTPLTGQPLAGQLGQSIVSIRLDKTDKVEAKSLAKGQLTLGALSIDEQCHNWNIAGGKPASSWTLQITNSDGLTSLPAIVDTTIDTIMVPQAVWAKNEFLQTLAEPKECDPGKVELFKLSINGLSYVVQPAHFLISGTEAGKCVSLLKPIAADEKDQQWRLGLPFLRSHCVAMDLQSKQVWLSNGEQLNTSNGGGASAISAVSSAFGLFLGLLGLIAPAALLLH